MGTSPQSEFFFPTPDRPFWGLRMCALSPPSRACRLRRVAVNGSAVRQFYVKQEGRICPWADLTPHSPWELVVRHPWRPGEPAVVQLEADGFRQEWPIGPAPAQGGFPSSWGPWYVSLVLSEDAGVARAAEPVHVSLNFFADQVRADCADLRVLAVQPETGEVRPASFQVLETAEWSDPELVGKEPFRYQPTRTVDLVLLADVPAGAERVYLVFHGRQDAPALLAPGALAVDHEADGGVSIENPFYRVKLHGPSGMIDEVFVKQGRDIRLDHHHEREGTVHWNPDIWSPPRPWVHTNDWPDACKNHSAPGPVCFVAKAYGDMPDGVSEVAMSVTYQFYSESPIIWMSSAIHVKSEVPAKSLRNGEIVFNRDVIDHVAWTDSAGLRRESRVEDLWPHPKTHEGWHIPPDAPWLCLYSPTAGVGFGQINVSRMEYRWDRGLPRVADSHYYVAVGPWVYIARALVYPWGGFNPSQTAVVPANSWYLERIAWLPLALEELSAGFGTLDEWTKRLRHPLTIRAHADVDPRTPEQFVNPAIRFPIQQTASQNILPEPGEPIVRRSPLKG